MGRLGLDLNPHFADDEKIRLGSGQDVTLHYDGIDTYLDLRAVGTGDLMIALASGFPAPDSGTIHIWSGSAGSVSGATNRQLVIENDGDAGINILTPSANVGALSFGDPGGNVVGGLLYVHTSDIMRLRIGGAIRLDYSAGLFDFQEATVIAAAGDLTIRSTGQIIFDDGSTEFMHIEADGDVSIGFPMSALGQLHVDQAGSVAAQPVLYLNQADVSEEMIEFSTTIGIGNAIEAVGAKALTTTHFIKVTLPGGLTRYIPVGTIS